MMSYALKIITVILVLLIVFTQTSSAKWWDLLFTGVMFILGSIGFMATGGLAIAVGLVIYTTGWGLVTYSLWDRYDHGGGPRIRVGEEPGGTVSKNRNLQGVTTPLLNKNYGIEKSSDIPIMNPDLQGIALPPPNDPSYGLILATNSLIAKINKYGYDVLTRADRNYIISDMNEVHNAIHKVKEEYLALGSDIAITQTQIDAAHAKLILDGHLPQYMIDYLQRCGRSQSDIDSVYQYLISSDCQLTSSSVLISQLLDEAAEGVKPYFVPSPTLTQWGVIILALLMVCASVWMIKRKRQRSAA